MCGCSKLNCLLYILDVWEYYRSRVIYINWLKFFVISPPTGNNIQFWWKSYLTTFMFNTWLLTIGKNNFKNNGTYNQFDKNVIKLIWCRCTNASMVKIGDYALYFAFKTFNFAQSSVDLIINDVEFEDRIRCGMIKKQKRWGGQDVCLGQHYSWKSEFM